MSFNVALTGIQAASSQLGVAANNIANVGTTGFKFSRAEFSDVYASTGGAASIGSGVRLSSVTQQFTQGITKTTGNSLDLAINGQGFFILNDGGSEIYTRAGAFGVDRNGYIVNSSGQVLRGYQADATGTVISTMGDLQINTANLSPQATSTVSATVNLDAKANAPSNLWSANTSFGQNPPETTTFNNTVSASIYDSLGNSHLMTMYLVKSETPNTWGVHVQIDGVDVTSSAKTNTLANTSSTLVNAGAVPVLNLGELTLNGVSVPTALAGNDAVSTSDNAGSSIATVAAINSVSGSTNVTATVNANTLNLGTYTPGALAGANFTINGTNIVPGAATQAALLVAINAATGATGVTGAADASGDIILTAADGRNIQVTSNGGAATADFSNFDLQSTLNQVQRGTFTLSSANPMTIAGSNPAEVNLQSVTWISPFTVAFNSDGTYNAAGSETISLNWDPLDSNGVANGAATPQTIAVSLASSTQFGGSFAVQSLSQNGYTTGRLNNMEVDSSGLIFGRYTNGQSLAMGQVVLANFASIQGLQPNGDTSWTETFRSGPAIVGQPGTASLGLIQSSSLEESNVQLTDELVGLIVAQRNFQANAQTIRTSDTVTQTIINLR